MTLPNSIVFLVDLDNTLLDNDRIQSEIKRHLDRDFGVACRERYWTILEQLFTDLGYRDYLGALSATESSIRVRDPDIDLITRVTVVRKCIVRREPYNGFVVSRFGVSTERGNLRTRGDWVPIQVYRGQ